jgi:hypothetical protein
MAVGEGDVRHGALREEDGGARTMGKEGEGTDNEMRGGGGGMQNQGRGGRRGGVAMGSLVLGVVGEELASWKGVVVIAIAATATARAAAQTRKLVDCQRATERDEGDWRRCRGEGRRIPYKTRGNLDHRGQRGRR